MNTPYLWGGCTRDGIDCSGLVQMSLLAAGRSVPRDSDMQEAAIGDALAMSEEERRGLATSQGVAARSFPTLMRSAADRIRVGKNDLSSKI
jgi:cell wall-associated NlpC family hydrolase